VDAGASAEDAAAARPEFLPVPASELPTLPPEPPDASEQTYVVAVEDVLEISVYGDPDLTRQVPVRPDGKISYTFVGDVQAAGRTIEEIRADLKETLATYLRSPEVTVIAREFGRQKVYVGGEVRQPGVYYLTPRENTLADVVYRAGLPSDRADVSGAVLVRGGRLVGVDFGRVLRGDLAGNVVLKNNDLLYIPEAAERFIYVLGEVRQQNALETTIPLSVLNVLTRSGGVNPGTAKSREIAVLRGGLKEPTVAVVNFKRLVEGDLSQNIMVRPGDIVYVPTTGLGRYNQFIEQILRTFTLLFQGRVVQQGFQ
jgi:polysaccharide export outer membrane protein